MELLIATFIAFGVLASFATIQFDLYMSKKAHI